MLVTLDPILKDAQTKGYAIGAFNMLNMETVEGAIRAAEELNSPIILQLAESHLPHAPLQYMAPILLAAAESARVPVCIHFDHATGYEIVSDAIAVGFSSVMFDGAELALEDNILLTREIVKMAHAFEASVEAELGRVGSGEDGNGGIKPGRLTDPRDAARFIAETGVDALAVSIGTQNGQYLNPPILNYDLLKEICKTVQIPLVIHGGTGTGAESFKKCIRLGIRKINIGTDIQLQTASKVRELLQKDDYKTSLLEIKTAIREGTYNCVKEHLLIFGSNGKA